MIELRSRQEQLIDDRCDHPEPIPALDQIVLPPTQRNRLSYQPYATAASSLAYLQSPCPQ